MKKNVVISMLVIALAAALLGGATFAWFTSEKELGTAAFTAGTLVLDGDGADVTFENIAPGWGTDGLKNWEVTLENTGSLDMYYRLYFVQTAELKELSKVLEVQIKIGEEEPLPFTALENLFITADPEELGVLEVDGDVAITLTFQLPTTVGNEYQGASWSGTLVAQGTQKDHQDDGDIEWSN